MKKYTFKTTLLLVSITAVIVLPWSSLAATQAGEALVRKGDCLGCHAVSVKMVGPAFHDVAEKYAGQADANAVLAASIKNGSTGKWGDLPMPPHSNLSPADLKKITDWILSIK